MADGRWVKICKRTIFSKLPVHSSSDFVLNYHLLWPILSTNVRSRDRGEQEMDWNKLLGSVTTALDQERWLRTAYLLVENRLLRQRESHAESNHDS